VPDKILTLFCHTLSSIFLGAETSITKEIEHRNNYLFLLLDRHSIIKTQNMLQTYTTILPNRNRQNSQTSYQQTSIAVNYNNLREPHILKIDSIAKQLSGEITLNGRLIKKVSGSKTRIDLAAYLTKGEHRIEIFLNYLPVSSAIAIGFNSPDTNMMQQTSGNGSLRHRLLIAVE
jgi:hypothetical protein